MARICDRCGAPAVEVKEIDIFKKKYDLCEMCVEVLDSMEVDFFKRVIKVVETYPEETELEKINAELQYIASEEIDNRQDEIVKGRNVTKIRNIMAYGCAEQCRYDCILSEECQEYCEEYGIFNSKEVAHRALCKIFDTDSITERILNNEKLKD